MEYKTRRYGASRINALSMRQEIFSQLFFLDGVTKICHEHSWAGVVHIIVSAPLAIVKWQSTLAHSATDRMGGMREHTNLVVVVLQSNEAKTSGLSIWVLFYLKMKFFL